jgi:hypothetical protein
MVSLSTQNEVYTRIILDKRLINYIAQNKGTRKGMTEVISIDQKKSRPVTEDEQQLTSTYSDSTISFLDNGIRYNNNNNHKSTIQELDLAQGLIQLLVENNFTLKSLLNTSPSELSKTLGIDQEVATLICKAAKNKKAP